MVVNTFGVSVAIEKIGWRLYLIYICWQVVELVTVYFFFPEVSFHFLIVCIHASTKSCSLFIPHRPQEEVSRNYRKSSTTRTQSRQA